MNTKEKIITVNGLSVKVIRKKIKNLHLAVYPPDGCVRIAVPEIIDDEAVRLAIVSRYEWIKRQTKSFQDQARESKREFTTGESHFYLGKRYLLDISHTSKSPYVEIRNKKKNSLKYKQKSWVGKSHKTSFGLVSKGNEKNTPFNYSEMGNSIWIKSLFLRY